MCLPAAGKHPGMIPMIPMLTTAASATITEVNIRKHANKPDEFNISMSSIAVINGVSCRLLIQVIGTGNPPVTLPLPTTPANITLSLP
jgi:hypothetical protein